MAKKRGNWLWRLQKGNPIEWFDGHLKGTGTIVKPIHTTPLYVENGKPIYGYLPDAFEVRDDATGNVRQFDLKNLAKIEKKPK
ncbi:hypothetical protein D3C87_588010 [compost metagenome]